MLSVVIDGPQSVRVDEVDDPAPPGPDGAVVRVIETGICGSDLHFYDGDIPVGSGLSVGHECIGEVVALGSAVSSFDRGDRVLVSSVAACGRCPECAATADPVRCEAGFAVFGSGMLPGAQATLLAVPAADFQLMRIPEGIGDEAALLLTDNLATGWVAAARADIEPGSTVAVVGAGAVGLCAIRSAFVLGAARVIAIDPVAGRRATAAASGAETCDPSVGDLGEQVGGMTGGRGADSVIEAVGREATITAAIRCVRVGGTVSVVGVPSGDGVPMPVMSALLRSNTVRFTTAPVQRAWRALVPLILAERLSTDGIFTHRFALADAPAAYRKASERADDCIKVRLTP